MPRKLQIAWVLTVIGGEYDNRWESPLSVHHTLADAQAAGSRHAGVPWRGHLRDGDYAIYEVPIDPL